MVLGGLVGILLLGGLIWKLPAKSDYASVATTPSNETASSPEVASPALASSPSSSAAPAPAALQPGSYVSYSDDIIKNTPGTKVLFFHAAWCSQCKALEASIRAGRIPDGVTIIKVDYDTSQSLRQKYGVTIQTTLVRVDNAGALIKKYIAYDTPTLESVKANLL